MEVLHILTVIALIGFNEAARCKNTTFYATPSLRWVNLLEEKSADCTYHIKPNTTYASKYYLKLDWWEVHVEGKMPTCEDEYIELFLTESKTYVGKFCTNNTEGVPYELVSYDGSATIRIFSKTNWIYGKIVFYMQVKPYAESLGGSQDKRCIINPLAHTGYIHSTGWPKGYMASQETCHYYVKNDLVQKEFVFIFWELDVDNRSPDVCDEQDDYVMIKGANEDDRSKAKPVSGRVCSMTQMRFFRTRYKHIFVEFVRQRGSGPAHRGFVVGFKGYFFKNGTIGPDERRNITNGTTKPGGDKKDGRNHAVLTTHSLSLVSFVFIFWQCLTLIN